MRIISKVKDYYDHCVSQFGYDETRVYDRRIVAHRGMHTQKEIAICGILYPVIYKYKENKFYFKKHEDLDYRENIFLSAHGRPTDLNKKFRQPVLIEKFAWNPKTYKMEGMRYEVPVLKEWGFPAFIPAEDMYMRIYDFMGWLKDNPGPPDNQTDKEKVVSHGFDVKTSFRPKIKK